VAQRRRGGINVRPATANAVLLESLTARIRKKAAKRRRMMGSELQTRSFLEKQMVQQSPADMPDQIANAVKLLWLSLAIAAFILVWALTSGFGFGAFLRFAIFAGLWAFAITLLPAQNNLARLGLLALTTYKSIMFLQIVLIAFSYLFTLPGILGLASVAAAIWGCLLLVREPADQWFGPLTDVSMTRG
jgi:hypothetical protein